LFIIYVIVQNKNILISLAVNPIKINPTNGYLILRHLFLNKIIMRESLFEFAVTHEPRPFTDEFVDKLGKGLQLFVQIELRTAFGTDEKEDLTQRSGVRKRVPENNTALVIAVEGFRVEEGEEVIFKCCETFMLFLGVL
jgi:hypothetical protein